MNEVANRLAVRVAVGYGMAEEGDNHDGDPRGKGVKDTADDSSERSV